MVFFIETLKGAWLIVFTPFGTQCELCTILLTQMNQWLTGSELITFIGHNQWTYTQNNKLSLSRKNNIKHFVMNM
jgi:hypothetical protein